ncbi:MAG: DUF4214 domain-containing protein [Halothiobacillaceae bacterium]
MVFSSRWFFILPSRRDLSFPGAWLLALFLTCSGGFGAMAFSASAEAAYIDQPSEFARQQYRDFLGREGDQAGVDYWAQAISSGAIARENVVLSFFLSAEFQAAIAPVVRLYYAYFNRIPDQDGLIYWLDQQASGTALETISQIFATSQEFVGTYGNLSDTQFVNLVYQNVLGRTPDAEGLNYWVGQLQSGMSRGALMVGFSESAEYQARSYNQVQVTMIYQGMLRRVPDQAGFDYWVQALNAGDSALALITSFLGSSEYLARFASLSGHVANYGETVKVANSASTSFLQTNNSWEGANFNNMTAEQVRALATQYVSQGEQVHGVLNHTVTLGNEVQSSVGAAATRGLEDEAMSVVDISGVSPALVKSVGDHIANTKDGVKACDTYWPDRPDEYKVCLDLLRQKQTLSAAGLGFSAIMGGGAAIIVGGAASAAAAPAAVVVGGAVLAGAAVGKTVSWLWNRCTGAKATETCYMSTGSAGVGQAFPNTMQGTGNLTIHIPGFVPVVLTNFTPPTDGQQLTLDFTPVPVDQTNPDQVITINFDEVPYVGQTCDDIQSITAYPSPAAPAPGQSVVVTATVLPIIAGCPINFRIEGTDGYSNEATYSSDAQGKASFTIPGAKEGVHDVVTIRANQASYVVTYTFGSAGAAPAGSYTPDLTSPRMR